MKIALGFVAGFAAAVVLVLQIEDRVRDRALLDIACRSEGLVAVVGDGATVCADLAAAIPIDVVMDRWTAEVDRLLGTSR